MILASHRDLLETDASLLGESPVGLARSDHRDLRPIALEVAEEEQQRAAADRAEADHDDGTVDPAVDGRSHAVAPMGPTVP